MRKFFILFLYIILLYSNIVFAIESTDDVSTKTKDPEISAVHNDDAIKIQKSESGEKNQNISDEIRNSKNIKSSKKELEKTDITKDDAPEDKSTLDFTPSQEKTDSKNAINEQSEKDSEKIDEITIRINEILPNPDGAGNEFIELYNNGNSGVHLNGWRLYDKTKKYYVFEDITIDSHDLLTLYNKQDFSFVLNNSDEEIYLEDENENIIAEFSYKTSSSGLSWNHDVKYYLESPTPDEQNNENPLTKEYSEIIINEIFPNPEGSDEKDEFIELYNPNNTNISLENWTLKDASQSGKYIFKNTVIPAKNYFVIYRSDFSFALNNSGDETISLIAPNEKVSSSVTYNSSRENLSLNHAHTWYWEKPTPNAENRENPLIKNYPTLLLSEILPNPIGDENTNEFIEIYNPHDFAVELEGWTFHDASAAGSFTFLNSSLIQSHSYHTIYRKKFSFALNNSNETLLFIAPNEKIMSQFSYESSRENISYNYDNETKKWRQSKHLTPNNKNIFNNLPKITKFDVDNKIYKNVYAEFKSKAYDIDKEKLKVRWDFGDNHKSYKWETRHKYESTGTFHGSLRIQDGSEEITKKFTTVVKEYPKHRVSITKIVPNPAGKDSGNEYIVVKNKSNKKINLKNWSIATGPEEKTLVNHPIHDDLYIKSGKTEIIKKKHAAISLPNKKGVIEIRRPNGSASHTKEYGDKSTSISDNASYEKIDGVWEWIVPIDQHSLLKTNGIITQALKNEMILSQQLLEQKIAYSAIYQEDNVANISRSLSKNRLSLLEEINKMINSIFIMTKKQLHVLFEKEPAYIAIEIHKIQENKNPCTAPYIATHDKYAFCK